MVFRRILIISILIVCFLMQKQNLFSDNINVQISNYSKLSEKEQETSFPNLYNQIIKLPDTVQIKHFTTVLNNYKDVKDENILKIVNKMSELYLELTKDDTYYLFLKKAIKSTIFNETSSFMGASDS